MRRLREELLGRRRLDDLAGIHHQHAVAALGDHREIVGDEEDRQAELAPQPLEELQDLRLQRDVEGGGRLVGDQQLGPGGERDRQHRALPLAARELVRELAQPAHRIGNRQQLEELEGAGPGGARRPTRAPLLRCARTASQIWVSRVRTGLSAAIGSWKTKTDTAAAHRPHLALGEARARFASVEQDLAGRRPGRGAAPVRGSPAP